MKKILFAIITAVLVSACNNDPEHAGQPVSFGVNYLTVQSGNLKSFDISKWEHYYWPYQVTVKLNHIATGANYAISAPNSFQFFTKGTSQTYLPYGDYNCTVQGGGWAEGGNAFPYFVWAISDTVITVTDTTHIIRFQLTNTPALIVKDAESPIVLKGIGLESVEWAGRGNNDFVYVTAPWPYAASYAGKFTTIDAKPGKYYYLQISPDTAQVGGVVDLPIFEGDTLRL